MFLSFLFSKWFSIGARRFSFVLFPVLFGMVISLMPSVVRVASSEETAATMTETQFHSAQKLGKSILLEFTASWCPTCRVQKKVLNALKEKGDLKGIELIEVDYDSEKTLKKVLNVNAQSTFVAFQGMLETKRATGLTSEKDVADFLKNAFSPASLKAKLSAMAEVSAAQLPPEVQAKMNAATDSLRKSKLEERAVKKGGQAPNFTLSDAEGKKISLKELLKKGPVVLTFYRGGWCPYCNEQLRSYQKTLPEFKAAGGQLVAVTPELPSNILTTAEKNAIEFKILTDPGNKTAQSYGLVFGVPEELKKLYLGFGVDLSKSQGNSEWNLPVPATYVIGRDQKVVYSFVSVDYKVRAEPSEILSALKSIH